MNKMIFFGIIILIAAMLLTVSIFATEATVYIGGDTADAVDTLDAAIRKLDGKGGKIVLCTPITVTKAITVPEQSGDLTITAQGNGALTVTAATLSLEKNTNATTVTLDMPLVTGTNGVTLYGGFNSVHFGKNFSVDGILDFYGGVAAAQSPEKYNNSTSMEEKLARNTACTTTLPYTITVDSGDFRIFTGGNYRASYANLIGAIAAKVDIIINGGSFNSAVTFGVEDAIKDDTAFSISGMSFLADEATLTINGGVFNTPIYAQGYVGQTGSYTTVGSLLVMSDETYYAADGDISITVTGGDLTNCIEINAEQTAASYNRVLRGNFTLTIAEDATLKENIVLDATQVKAYTGITDKKATLNYPVEKTVCIKRFDTVNGTDMTGTFTEPIRIACIGDSITQGGGYHMDGTGIDGNFAHLSYPANLYKIAVENERDVIVSNYGYSSSCIMERGGLRYNESLGYVLSQKETDADYVIIGIGTNDASATGHSVGFADNFCTEYEKFVKSYEELPCTRMVYGTTATYRSGSDISAVSLIRGMQRQVLSDLSAAGKNVTLIDLYALTLEDALGGRMISSKDNLHPHTEGFVLYANTIYNAVLAESPVTVPEDFFMTEIYLASEENGGSYTGKGTKDDPTTELSVALGKADPNGATIYVIGEYAHTKLSQNLPFNTPRGLQNLTIKGYGENAVLSLNTKLLYLNSNVTFDNITLRYSSTSALYISCGYHDVTFTETFKTAGASYALIVAGYIAFNDDDFSASFYTPVASLSTDRDCTITVNGGAYAYFLGGNLHYPSTGSAARAPYGTYSGNMTVNIGAGVTINTGVRTALVGMNYLTGTVTANLSAWADEPIREYSTLTFYSERVAEYDPAKNTGSVTVNFTDGFEKPILRAGDINQDGAVNIADALLLLRYTFTGTDANYNSASYFYQTSFSLTDVLYMLKKVAK